MSTTMEFFKRGERAIEYGKSSLDSRDTLVILHPEDCKPLDPTGFALNKELRVHSRRLVFTDSKKFEKIFSVDSRSMWYPFHDAVAAVNSNRASTPKASNYQPILPITNTYKAYRPPARDLASDEITFHADMLEALTISAREHGVSYQGVKSLDAHRQMNDVSVEDVLEYFPLRYRLAIGHLLQIIEGREPTWLDSGPKVWTLYVVVKYFELQQTDRIFAWMFSPKNEIFVEVLPEATLKTGFGLQHSIIARSAFGVLVSKEALRIAPSDGCPNIPKGILDIDETRFLRPRKHLDEVYMDLVQNAGEKFYGRVKHTWEDLCDPNMDWLRSLPEWEKISRFKDHVSSLDDKVVTQKNEEVIELLEQTLTDYVRGPIIRCLYETMPSTQVPTANNHRRLQQYTRPFLTNIKTIYDSFTSQERTMTLFF
ncbi:hypothetical protein G7Y89_g11115 [Cudoniella acicularis]|uniref:Uncharacterized protein n=1 Tax=Cudoniella acicularis TaxID=354080 RepID=A0A8H4VYB9_9HELO|nr:hypothetical protein G7Y89_g11115 [Cudoniella acicularis]